MAVVVGPYVSESTRPTCSVCIANHNGEAVLIDCIDSVLAQVAETSYEVIIHDDASSDNSLSLVRERYPSARYPNIRIIESKENVGFCISNNRMAAEARGEYLLLLNNDAALLPDALHTLYSRAKILEKPAILGLPQYDAATGILIDVGSRFDPFLNPIPHFPAEGDTVGMVIGACLWLPKSLWEELGGFPEWFGSLAEDMYLCILARMRGYPVQALPSSGFRHWVGKSLGGGKVISGRLSTKATRRALSERNKSFVMCITYPAPFLQLLLPLHLTLLLLEGTVLAIFKRNAGLFRTVYLGCLFSLWQQRHRLASSRRDLQAARTCRLIEFFGVFDWVPHKIRLLLRHGIPEIS